MVSLTLPPDNSDTLREQLAENADPGQIASLGESGMMFVPTDSVYGLVKCNDCGDAYLNAEYLRNHECPARPMIRIEEDDNADGRRAESSKPDSGTPARRTGSHRRQSRSE